MSALIPRDSNALAIDPGYGRKGRGNAVAYAKKGSLAAVWFKRSENAFTEESDAEPAGDFFESLYAVIVEQPQQDGRSWAVPPAVLIKLAFEGAALAGLYAGAACPPAALLTPTVTEWKGSEKKPPHHKRLWAVLSPAERLVLGGAKTLTVIEAACEKGALCRWSLSSDELYPRAFKTHNLLDAAALLMWAFGRLEKAG